MDSQKKLSEIDKKIVLVSILDTPGAILVGLGLYAKFAANGSAFLPVLNNQMVVNNMLFAGVIIMGWSAYKIISLIREKARLAAEQGNPD